MDSITNALLHMKYKRNYHQNQSKDPEVPQLEKETEMKQQPLTV